MEGVELDFGLSLSEIVTMLKNAEAWDYEGTAEFYWGLLLEHI